MSDVPTMIYAFRLNSQDKWSFSEDLPALKDLAHEVQVFTPDGGIIKVNPHGFRYRADQ